MSVARRIAVVAVAAVAALAGSPATSYAQGTQADYDRALALRERFDQKKVPGAPDSPVWIGETGRFHYRLFTTAGHDFILVDAKTGERKPAFDHDAVAASLSKLTGEQYTGAALPFNSFRFVDDEKAIAVTFDGTSYRCTVADSACRKSDAPAGGRGFAPGRGGGPGAAQGTQPRT
ncbi:MAG TPA: hypothetical protein VFZ36_10255, partial [Vicinamibacterales bacterium]